MNTWRHPRDPNDPYPDDGEPEPESAILQLDRMWPHKYHGSDIEGLGQFILATLEDHKRDATLATEAICAEVLATIWEQCAESVEQEREACAKIAEAHAADKFGRGYAKDLAAIIRNRKKARCADCGGTDDDHIANYYCPEYRPILQP